MLFDKSDVIVRDKDIVFVSSFIRGGNLFFPEKLIFTKKMVTVIKNHGIENYYTSETKQSIPYNKITGINVRRDLIGCRIEIIGDGYQSIVSTPYSGVLADKIEDMVNIILEDN